MDSAPNTPAVDWPAPSEATETEIKIQETRRRDQETISNQMIGFALVTEAALAAAYAQAHDSPSQFWIAVFGGLAVVVFLAFYVRTRITELALSRFVEASRRARTMSTVVDDAGTVRPPDWHVLDDAAIRWVARVKYMHVWTIVLLAGGFGWIAAARHSGYGRFGWVAGVLFLAYVAIGAVFLVAWARTRRRNREKPK